MFSSHTADLLQGNPLLLEVWISSIKVFPRFARADNSQMLASIKVAILDHSSKCQEVAVMRAWWTRFRFRIRFHSAILTHNLTKWKAKGSSWRKAEANSSDQARLAKIRMRRSTRHASLKTKQNGYNELFVNYQHHLYSKNGSRRKESRS